MTKPRKIRSSKLRAVEMNAKVCIYTPRRNLRKLIFAAVKTADLFHKQVFILLYANPRETMQLIEPFVFICALWLHAQAQIIPFDDWEYQRVALKDVNIHFRYAGKGPPLLLVHGFPQHSVSESSKLFESDRLMSHS